MSKKHVDAYYRQICNQYSEMKEAIAEFSRECESNMVEPERLENMQRTMAPIKDNYERWSYMMYLLNMPNNPQKINRYTKTHKIITNERSIKSTLASNERALNKLKNFDF